MLLRLAQVARYRSVEVILILVSVVPFQPAEVVVVTVVMAVVVRFAVLFCLVDLPFQPLQVTTAVNHRSPLVFHSLGAEY